MLNVQGKFNQPTVSVNRNTGRMNPPYARVSLNRVR